MNLNCICSKLFVFDEERICYYPVLTYLKGSSVSPLMIQVKVLISLSNYTKYVTKIIYKPLPERLNIYG